MGSASRLSRALTVALVVCGLLAVVIGAVGVMGVRQTAQTAKSVVADELRTATTTAALNHGVDVSYSEGQSLARTASGPSASQLVTELSDVQIPRTEAALGALRRLHEGDAAAEQDDISLLARQWALLRNLLNRVHPTWSYVGVAARLTAAYDPLSRHLATLGAREAQDASDDQVRSAAQSSGVVRGIALVVMVGLLFLLALGTAGAKMLRRALEPAQDQIEFAETLQLAQDESEAHSLLQHHLQRTVFGSAVTVLNRNNSADRLEAVTKLPDGSPLLVRLTHAEPRSCLAVRSGRIHQQNAARPALLACSVCQSGAGNSTCTPLTVGGEVIGSVLVSRATNYKTSENLLVQNAVSQAAPVLANLRNLAIAEVRAATDSLTGLPNKRAVGDTIKRMLAQASRSQAPLSLLVLDLDHFKQINDRFGHQVGDQALANVGAVLRSALRDGDFAGRNGGEEFTVLLPDTDSKGAMVTAERILAGISDITVPGLDLVITASIGVAASPEHAISPERLERLADSALYTAKRGGRNRVETAQPTADPSTHQPTESSPAPLTSINGTAMSMLPDGTAG